MQSRAFVPYTNTNINAAAGFTLVELLVVLAIIAILSSVAYFSFSDAGVSGRNVERQAGLRELSSALEAYRRDNGEYPAANPFCGSTWATETGGSGCATSYINNLVPLYINELPNDPRPGSGDGFAYRTNSEGSVYKVMVRGSVEGSAVTADHDFAPCTTELGCSCSTGSTVFQTSYATWSGFAETDSDTRNIICPL